MRRLSWYAPPLLWALVLFCLSAQPSLPETPGGDKLAHATAYALLAALTLRALYHGTGWPPALLAVSAIALAAVYGLSDEFHQSFVPGRDASGWDALADAVGAGLGAPAMLALYRWRGTKRSC